VRRSVLVPLVIVAGIALVIGLFFVFRSGSDEDETTPAATTVETTTEEIGTSEPVIERTLEVTVQDAKAVGGVQHLTVDKGDRVSITVTSDVEDEVHVHGYDLMQDVAPGEPVQIRFTATIAGRFEVELEERGTPIAELEVR
jgi:heme/copper-type cytochrome/quinol oxidase subunit 2